MGDARESWYRSRMRETAGRTSERSRTSSARKPRAPSRLLGALAVGLGSVACSDNAPTGDAGAGDGGSGVAWTACHDDYECATIPVPIDYDDPASGMVGLRVMRARASGERRGVLLVNQGGPGDPTVAWLVDFYPLAAGVFFPLTTEHFDVIAVDWRGVGESEQIQCDFAAADATFRQLPLHPAPGAERDAYADLFARYQSSCTDGHGGALVSRMGTEHAARDMDRVRQALGEDQISFLGMSYGGYLGAVYASLFPDRVRAFVLDSPASPSPDILMDVTSWATAIEPHYQAFFEQCGADPGCVFHGGEGADAVALAYDGVLADLESSGGIAVGASTLTRSDAGKAIYPMAIGGDVDALAADLHDLEAGDGEALLARANGWYAGSRPDLLDTQVIICLDRAESSDGTDPFWDHLGALESGAAPHVAFDISAYWGMCRDWPVQRPAVAVSAPSAPPLLVVAGNTDIWAPRAYAEATVAALSNGSYLLIGDGPGHVQSTQLTTSMCAAHAVDQFLLDPSAPSTTDCNPAPSP